MFRKTCAALAMVGSTVLMPASPASATLSCNSVFVCANASIAATTNGCWWFGVSGWRQCERSFTWRASATSVVPGTLDWKVTTPTRQEEDSCTIVLECESSTTGTTWSNSEPLPCGTTKTYSGTITAHARAGTYDEPANDSASITVTVLC